MDTRTFGRRAFLGGSAVSALALAQARATAGEAGGTDETFAFEITRSDEDWRAMLSRDEYVVLRKGSTELPKSNPLWNNTAEGTYCCRGCDLTVFDSVWKVELDKGWLFFRQSVENAVLMGIDGQPPDGMAPEDERYGALIEAHCRRCGSHLGHILTVEGKTLHCINGTSLQFRPTLA
ncbi:MAG: peptide-methionine (R)-S-oxide reductase [Rhodobacter sp.]|nr:peptide-methionine (R)-S-oxide reductase [Rhodobacter sp.]